MENNKLLFSKYNPDDYQDKKLIWFKDDCKRHYRLSVDSGVLTATDVALIRSTGVSSENLIIPVKKTIDEDIVKIMEKPKSRFLSNQCDFVIFQNSPNSQSKFSN